MISLLAQRWRGYSLPLAQHRNIALFYLITAFCSAFFVAGNWMFFWLRYMTYGQLGVIDATVFAYGMLMEIPSGAIADMFGKKKTLIVAMIFLCVGITITAAAQDQWWIIGGFLIAQTGWAFQSGAIEALAYDTLKETGDEQHYDQVIGMSHSITVVMSVISSLAGGALYAAHYRLPHYAWGGFYFFALIATLFLIEPRIDSVKFSLRNYFRQLVEGSRQLMQPSLRHFVPLILTVLGVFFVFNFGLVAPIIAADFGFYADEQAVIQSVLGIFTAIALSFLPLLREKWDDMTGLFTLALLIGIGCFGAALPLGYGGFFVLVLITVSGRLATPWVSVVVNREIPSEYRATTLSTVALITKLPYVLTAILAGQMVEAGKLWLFNVGFGIMVLLVLAGSWIAYRARKSS